jgi:Sulfotransferase domain
VAADRAKATGRWPNLFIVGAARAGTTSLYHYLGQHPEIYMSPLKEPDFFSPGANPRRWVEKAYTEDAYLALFRGAGPEKLLGEASTSYLWFPTAAEAIHARVPLAKILIVLREPIERAYSHYLMDVSDGVEDRGFYEVIRDSARDGVPSYADFGLYCEQVKRYLDLFAGQVLVVFFDQLFADVRPWLRRMFEFLAVDPGFSDNVRLDWHHLYARPRNRVGRALVDSAGSVRRMLGRPVLPRVLQKPARRLVLTTGAKPPLDPDAHAYLAALYQGQRECLRSLLGIEPPWKPVREE